MALIPHPSTTAYFDGSRTATIRVRGADEITVESASDPSAWTSATSLADIVNIKGIKEVTLVGGQRVPLSELSTISGNVDGDQVGLLLRGFDKDTGAILFEADSQNSDLNASNDNLLYRGLRVVLRDMRLGPWRGPANDYDGGVTYASGDFVFYLNVAYVCILASTGNAPPNATYWLVYQFAAGDRISYVRGLTALGFVSLVDSNSEVPIPGDWSSGATYAVGAKVFYLNTAYKSLQAGNINHTPSSSPTWWMVYYSENWTLRQFIADLSYGTSKLSYVFTYTLVNDWSEEGPPADPVSIDADYGATVSLHGYIDISGANNHYTDYRKGPVGYRLRYYGFVADSTGAGEYRLIHETDELGASFAGAFGHQITNRPADWQDPLATVNFELPPASPIAIAVGENGMLGIVTQSYFAPCEPFKGWTWPTDFRKALSARAVGLLNTPGGWLITTQKKPRFAAGPIPEQISLQEILIEQAGISQKAMCSMGERGTAYASNDGIVIVQGLGATLASGVLFTRKEWRVRYGALLSKMRLAYHDGRLVALFPGTAQSEASNYQGFMIRFDDGVPMYTRLSITGSGVAVDTLNDQLLIANLTGFKAFEDGVALPLTWQSKEFITARPENMGAAMIAYTGGPLTIDVHADGATVLTKTLPYAASRVEARWRLPAGYKSQRWSLYVAEGVPLNWSGATTYASGDTVTSGGVPWVSLQATNLNHAPATGSAYWSQIGGETVHRLLLATTMAELARA